MIWLVKHAVCALYPETDALPGVAQLDVDAFLRRFRRETTALFWTGILLGAVLFILTPVFTVGLPLPSFLLPRGALDLHAKKVSVHPWYFLRQPVFLVKMVGGLCWGQHPRVRALNNLPKYEDDPGTYRAA